MKTKQFLVAVAFATMAFTFSACGDDSKEGPKLSCEEAGSIFSAVNMDGFKEICMEKWRNGELPDAQGCGNNKECVQNAIANCVEQEIPAESINTLCGGKKFMACVMEYEDACGWGDD